jgi:predicted nucleic acid-binding protein
VKRSLVSLTVILEVEWVLRSGYGFDRVKVAKAFRAFAGLPQVIVQDRAALDAALISTEAGMDFADGLHLAQAGQSEAFVTFDDRFYKAAKRGGAIDVRRL